MNIRFKTIKKGEWVQASGRTALRYDVRVGEISAFEQQRFTGFFCKRVRKAVAEIQFCRMPTTLSEISIGASCNLRLSFRDRLDRDVCFLDEIVKPPRGYGIAACIDHNGGFNVINRTNTADRRIGNRSHTGHCFRLISEDGDDRGRIDNHFGSPRSSYSMSS